MTLWIPGPLPGLNEMLAAAKSGRGAGNAYARSKRAWTDTVHLLAKAAKLPRMERARFHFRWIETTKKRNPDNIAAAKKFCLDGLVAAGVLRNDGWGEIAGFTDEFEVGPRPGVAVTIDPAP